MNKRPPRSGEKVEKIQNTLLVDGNALFKTGFFGAKDEYNSNGKHIGGVYQFLTMLRKLLTEDLYHRVYVFWDGEYSGLLRYQIYEPYKSDRGKDYINGTKPIDVSEMEQIMMIWNYLDEMYVRQLRNNIIEGDDFIAYYCLNKKPNEKITICTNDTDMAQLINEDVRIYYLHLKNYVDKANFSSYFCYIPENAALIKGMIGDTADSIKGIKGLGIKTLVTLFPMLTERKVVINEIIEDAKRQQEERIVEKKKPLMVLTNIVDCVTTGVQGNKLYEINDKLVNLKNPLMTEEGIEQLKQLTEGSLNFTDRELKAVFKMMEKDGLDKKIGDYRYPDYLLPFKKLISREK